MMPAVGTVVLDSGGLSAWITRDRKVMAKIQESINLGADLVVSANSIMEVSHARVSVPRLNWVLSQVGVEPVTEEVAKAAAALLKAAGLHGHKHAIDATVAEVALRRAGPVVMLTSDVDDMSKLCGDQVRLVAV
ncbi:DNA-binding protein [Frankia sp. CNm7]|uniref:PIN domain-containing protein n=1 Tax=Frankia nepalensis TaxID=1836974 RepID=UPI001DD5C815|nr:DNA-binding protein [Frankia nepalensis]MBL7513008.1 DNA-binding protein [Frankia nepalensis]MBL7523630.1 DNA-binding protein [Frankia nepalensis]